LMDIAIATKINVQICGSSGQFLHACYMFISEFQFPKPRIVGKYVNAAVNLVKR
jgi:hypothetical protein